MNLPINFHLSLRQKRLLRWIGYPLLALMTFVFALSHTFPYDRLKGKVAEMMADKYDVEIESIDPTFFPGGLVLTNVSLTTRPTKPEEKPVTIQIDEITLDVGLLSAIAGNLDLDIEAVIGDGTIEGEVSISDAAMEAHIETSSLPLDGLPGVAAAIGLPMAGSLDATIDLTLPKKKWADAEGLIELSCSGCTVGDGKAKLKMQPRSGPDGARRMRRTAMWAAEGLTVPRLSLGDMGAEIEIKKGVGTIKRLAAKSKDGELSIEGRIEFKDPVKQSKFPACLRFKLSDGLKEREPDFGNIEFMLPALARQPDGTFAIPTKGTLAQFGFDPKRRCAGDGDEGDTGGRERPTITRRDDDSGRDPTGGDDRVRRAGSQPTTGEPETAEPGNSGPNLGASSLRTLRNGRDDVQGNDAGPAGAEHKDSGVPAPPPAEAPPPEPPPAEPPPEPPALEQEMPQPQQGEQLIEPETNGN